MRAPLLLADQLAVPPSSIVFILPPAAVAVFWVWAMVLLAALFIALLPLIRHDQTARFWALGMILCLPPICATMPHSRLLFFVGLGGLGLVAQWFVAFKEHADWLPKGRRWQSLGRAVLVVFFVAHGIIAPILLPLNALSTTPAEAYIQGAVNSAPLGPDVAEKDLIIVNPPSVYYAHHFLTVRALNNAPQPRHLRVLAPGTTLLHISRPDEHTLVIRPEGGFLAYPFDNVFRGDVYPLRLGQRIALTNMTAEITELTADGRPSEATFRFAAPLESDLFSWLQWKDGIYVPFEPPRPGAEITLAAQRLF
ncbi:hypothetical protein EHM92_01285 [bacterium]|nr:MAG: hypothetical protein EHM92_01285 [bacterium]